MELKLQRNEITKEKKTDRKSKLNITTLEIVFHIHEIK